MKKLTKKQTEIILNNIKNNCELQKQFKKLKYFNDNDFLNNAIAYINAIEDRRMLCIIESVSSSGMSRVLNFKSFEIYKDKKNNNGKGYFRNYFQLFKALGYTEAKRGFRINGCGMPMVFATNYNIIHTLTNLGFMDKTTCSKLAQLTPVNL